MITYNLPDAPAVKVSGFNQKHRDIWIQHVAKEIPAHSVVLDIGAGTCPYRNLFSHCTYKTQDFKQLDNIKLGGNHGYGKIDYVCDATHIPADSASFDYVICTEVLEHIIEPLLVIKEISRLLKSGGKAIITAPLCSGLHQTPYHYYGGFTPDWYKTAFSRYSMQIVSIDSNGTFFHLLAQECNRAGALIQKYNLANSTVVDLFNNWIAKFAFALESNQQIPMFTIGYHVIGKKQ